MAKFSKTPMEMLTRYVVWSLVFLSLSSVTSLITVAIPCMDWPTSGAAVVYRLDRFNLGSFIFYVLQLVLGYLYSTKVVIFWNKTLWKTRRHWFAVLGCGIPLYFVGPLFVLNGECEAEDVPFGERFLRMWIRCVPCFALFQYFAEYWTLLDFVDGLGTIVLNKHFIRQWKFKQYAVLSFGLSIGLGLAAYDLYLVHEIGRLHWYLSVFFGIIFGFFAIALALQKWYHVHIHHYCMGLLAPFFPVKETLFSPCMQAVFIGIALEGFARWGPDPIFNRNHDEPPSKRSDEIVAVVKADDNKEGAELLPHANPLLHGQKNDDDIAAVTTKGIDTQSIPVSPLLDAVAVNADLATPVKSV